jgi:3-oxoacyl-[acyl-carrier-protein] synthase II
MALYIHGMGNISPQKTWGESALFSPPRDHQGSRLSCIEPDYDLYIDPRQLRRMSRVIKMGVAAGAMALKEAGLNVPSGIITGTGYGCLKDTGIFLGKMIDNKEKALNPTPFIQSTHNTIGSQIALLLQCQGYNQTYTQGAISFESSLLDALLELNDNPHQSILVGGVDEITTTLHTILHRFNIFRKSSASSIALFNTSAAGTLHGEGATYFVLSGEKRKNDRVVLDSVKTFFKPNPKQVTEGIRQFLESVSLKNSEIDLVLLGKCGDQKLDNVSEKVLTTLFPENSIGLFKHLSGEYPTASAFAVWLGARIIQTQQIPDVVLPGNAGRSIANVLIYNSYFGRHHSLILLRAC